MGLTRTRRTTRTTSAQGVAINPLAVATIQRLPQRTIESTRPRPGTVSPTIAVRIPAGPSSTTVPPRTSRTTQPSIVVGRVSGAGERGSRAGIEAVDRSAVAVRELSTSGRDNAPVGKLGVLGGVVTGVPSAVCFRTFSILLALKSVRPGELSF